MALNKRWTGNQLTSLSPRCDTLTAAFLFSGGWLPMLVGLLYLFLFQLFGHITVVLLGLPIPSPVMGLVYLFGFLLVKGHIPEPLVKVASTLLPLLPLFLIPASAGIVEHGGLLKEDGIAIAIALAVSLTISILVTPFIFLFFARLFNKDS